MTVPRFLIIALTLVGIIVAYLTVASPQTGKWVYMWQAYVLGKPAIGHSSSSSNERTIYLTPPKGYSGLMNCWSSRGVLKEIASVSGGDIVQRFHVECDRNGGIRIIRTADPKVIKLLESQDNADFTGNPFITVYDRDTGIDRRAEFGIPVE